MSQSQVTIVVDPGVSTGVAVFRHKSLVTSFTCQPPFDQLWRTIKRFAQQPGTVLSLVVEEPPASGHQMESTDLYKQLQLADCHSVRPSEWKGHPAARLLQGDHPATKHERDVIQLGRYWLRTHASKTPTV